MSKLAIEMVDRRMDRIIDIVNGQSKEMVKADNEVRRSIGELRDAHNELVTKFNALHAKIERVICTINKYENDTEEPT